MKIKDVFTRYNLLFRLILALLLIVCVPILIIGWFVVDRTHANVQQQNQEMQLLNTSHFMEYFRAQRADMIGTAIKIGYDQKIDAQTIEAHPYNEIEAIDLLYYYKLAAPLSSKMFLHFRGKDYLIGSQEKYTKDIFIDVFSNSDEQNARTLKDMLDNDSGGRVRYLSNLNSADREATFPGMLISVPISIKRRNDAIVVYYLSKETLDAAFLGKMTSDHYSLGILDSQGIPLLYNHTLVGQVVQREDFQSFFANADMLTTTLPANGETYSIYKLYDQNLNLCFVLMAPQASISEPVQAFYQLLQATIVIVIAVLVIMLASVVYIYYRPILDLTRRIRQSNEMKPDAGELEMINLALEQKDTENETLMEAIAEHKLKLTDYMLKSLLEGKPVTPSEIDSIGLALRGPYYCVVAAAGVTLHNVELQDITDQIYNRCGSHASIAQAFDQSNLIFICTLPQAGDDARHHLAQTIDELLSQSQRSSFKLGVGSCEHNLDAVRSSYLSAMIALDQDSCQRILYYEQAVNSFSCFENYPSEAVLRFIQFIKQGEKDAAIAEFDKVIHHVSQNVVSHIIERYVCHDIVNVFIKALIRLDITLTDRDTHSILLYSNLDGLRAGMVDLIALVCEEIAQRKLNSGRELVENVKHFIDKHYSDANLNLPMVADHFNISIYTLSGVFNETTGMGFREYIVNRRIERSRHMLLSTDKSVKEVAYDVGFRDVSYFIKTFKKHCGVTPNRYKQDTL